MLPIQKVPDVYPRSVLAAIVSWVLIAICFTACGNAPYERNDSCGFVIVGNSLLLFVDHVSGYKKWTYGMSHQTGVTITNQQFVVLVYDLGTTSSSLRNSKSASFLFSDDDEARYEFKAASENEILALRRSKNGAACLRRVAAPSLKICITYSEHLLGNEPFFFDQSMEYCVPNRNPLQTTSAHSFQPISPNPLGRIFEQRTFLEEAKNRRVTITEDLKFVALLPENNSLGISVYGQNGDRMQQTISLGTGYTVKNVQATDDGLSWLCQSTNIVIGSFDGGARYKTDANGHVEWDAKTHRVLVIPFSFNPYQRQAFEAPLSVWSYTQNRTQTVRLDFKDFEESVKRVLAK
jgi:hypothetical protein